MTDRVLLSAGAHNIEACVALAVRHGLGIELMAFAYPDVLDGDWERLVAAYRPLLAPVPGMLAMHGPFMDMAPGSPDRRVNQIAIERYQQAIRIAAELDVQVIVFHANFIASIHTDVYRQGWQQRNIAFWGLMAEYARQHGVVIAVENMWEYDPDIIGDVLKTVNHPSLRACLDVGHAHLFSDEPFQDWLETLSPFLVHAHINNNDGISDRHRALTDGVLDYPALLPQLRALPVPPTLTLEMDTVDDLERSLPLLQLAQPAVRWRAETERGS